MARRLTAPEPPRRSRCLKCGAPPTSRLRARERYDERTNSGRQLVVRFKVHSCAHLRARQIPTDMAFCSNCRPLPLFETVNP